MKERLNFKRDCRHAPSIVNVRIEESHVPVCLLATTDNSYFSSTHSLLHEYSLRNSPLGRLLTPKMRLPQLSTFRELGYGVLFFVCAMLGMWLGLSCLVSPIRSGPIDYEIWKDVRAAVIGAIGGSVFWLWCRYKFLRRPGAGPRPNF